MREIFEIISHKWDLAILTNLRERPLRYTDLRDQIGSVNSDLSEGVLNKNLKRLKTGGLVCQRSTDEHHRVWALTPRGRQMISGLVQAAEFQSADDSQCGPLADSDPDRTTRDADPPPGPRHDGGAKRDDRSGPSDHDADAG